MKIVLVDNLIMPDEGGRASLDVHPHLGLIALATVAAAEGHLVDVYDPKRAIKWGELSYDDTLYDRAAIALLAKGPDAIGFTTLGCSFVFALNVASRLKQREPDLPVLLGGPHATMLHREILERFPQFDVIVRHEADEILPSVLDEIETRRFDFIPGISWRSSARAPHLRFTEGRPKVEDLDTLPIPSYDSYPVADLGLDLLRIEAGRGCPFMCTFCSTAGFFQRSFRLKSAARLVKELDVLHARYGATDFKLDHDMFTVNRRKVIEFCEAVSGRGYRWRASARVDGVDRDLLERMAAAGCAALYFGIETGSARMQRICEKRLDLALVQPILDAARGLGIETTASFITGYPEEAEEDQDDTLDLLGRCFRPGCLPQLHILAPEPGTPLFAAHREDIAYDGYGGPYNTDLLGPGDERLVREHPDIFQTYYYYPAAMPRARYVFAVEAVDVLRRLGPIVFAYLLRAYHGLLSDLVGDLRRFARSREDGGRPDAALLEAYVAAVFGRRHHLTSLVRYALCVQAMRAAQGAMSRTIGAAPFDPATAYTLARDVRVMNDMHDCGALLDQIARADETRLLDEADVDPPGSYIVSLAAGSPAMSRIDPGVEWILGLFDPPRTCDEVSAIVREATGLTRLPRAFFKDLARHGLIAAG